MRNYEKLWEIMRNYEKLWENMRKHEKLWEIMRNYEKLWEIIEKSDFQSDVERCFIVLLWSHLKIIIIDPRGKIITNN